MTLKILCELIYPVANPWDSFEQRERHEHRDLGRRSRPELSRERDRVRLRLILDDAPPEWILDRLRRIGETLGDAR